MWYSHIRSVTRMQLWSRNLPCLVAFRMRCLEIPLSRARVLLADDHSVMLDRVRVLLSSSFEVVGAVTNGLEMISAGIRLDPDVIVADITMPGLTGIEAAQQLREAGSRARFVFLTIHIEHEFVDACVSQGALGYVLKSHMKTDLIPAIKAALMGRTFISPLVSR
jgi:DNA-binding NarL/FixJ family response regulator